METIGHTKKLLIGTLAVACVLIAGYGYAVSEIFNINQHTQELEASVRLSSFREDIDRTTRTVLSTTEQSRAVLDSLFLKEDEIVAFIEHVESFSSITEASLDVRKIDIAEAEEGKDIYEWLTLSIVVAGSWQEVYHALSLFENLPVVLVLDDAELENIQGVEGGALWTGEFDIRVAKEKTS